MFRDRRILCARISRDHHVALLFRLHEFPRDIALDDVVSKIPPQRIATEGLNLKALLQRQPASSEADIHEPRAGEVGVRENWEHKKPADTTRASSKAQVKYFASLPLCDGLEASGQLNSGETNFLQILKGWVVELGIACRVIRISVGYNYHHSLTRAS